MGGEEKRGKKMKKGGGGGNEEGSGSVIVAVKASGEIPKRALIWALTHVVQPGDRITLLVVVTPQASSGKKSWAFPRFSGGCASGTQKQCTGSTAEWKADISNSYFRMIPWLHDVYDPNKISVKIKIVPGTPSGVVASEAKKAQASWVVLDKHLRCEEKHCLEELQCNIVVMKRPQPKVLRLNLLGSPREKSQQTSASPGEPHEAPNKCGKTQVTPNSSPEQGTPFTATEVGTSSTSSSDPGTSPSLVSKIIGNMKKMELASIREWKNHDLYSSDSESESQSLPSTSLRFEPWIASRFVKEGPHMPDIELFKLDRVVTMGKLKCENDDLESSRYLREATSLCSICRHKAPLFGKPPRWFSYSELDLATGGFSHANFLAEGGFGSVHRGVLHDGQVVAVKQHKSASSQGDEEFCAEVEVLSCAQHKNVVMLVGFCIEGERRLLVYEYVCNGSLDSHLYGNFQEPLAWSSRKKIAIGAARGLRYLHEECRVGCIIHRDMRPNNILLTHDFEPLVGDFGLARWQPDGDTGVETCILGTFGYLAPEYAQTGQITEKADVYSFGVVLVELVTGRKAIDLHRPKGQQCLAEWARPLLEENAIDELIDPRLGDRYPEHEVLHMLHAASSCIQRDPESRPRISQVLRILEGDVPDDINIMPTPSFDSYQ